MKTQAKFYPASQSLQGSVSHSSSERSYASPGWRGKLHNGIEHWKMETVVGIVKLYSA